MAFLHAVFLNDNNPYSYALLGHMDVTEGAPSLGWRVTSAGPNIHGYPFIYYGCHVVVIHFPCSSH